MYFFFFKQKTAYELRISDWSSDVCSSDLSDSTASVRVSRASRSSASLAIRSVRSTTVPIEMVRPPSVARREDTAPQNSVPSAFFMRVTRPSSRPFSISSLVQASRSSRSEEHTSELQSLMRISYAVFCLKKKKKVQQQPDKIVKYSTFSDK